LATENPHERGTGREEWENGKMGMDNENNEKGIYLHTYLTVDNEEKKQLKYNTTCE